MAVRWYLTYPLSYRQVCEMLRDRGVTVSPSTVMRWVFRYAPELDKRWRRYEKPVGLSWRCDETYIDETYIKVAGEWTSLYRAVGQNGKTGSDCAIAALIPLGNSRFVPSRTSETISR